ncbi:DUF2256 domain-containing protein [Maribius pontilimi]|uniref:DUF2256 domain-containing protein n=1 Tax=Palleronia pontilimi TaxID=1964209 RepID=A0A934MGX3_9RHOB|nr:DUF2256 domain-containing protein [Palleronia pontilimi]
MPRGVAKADLPQKECSFCGRPFVWRKKWRRDWDSVKYCSDKCRALARRTSTSQRPNNEAP